MSNLGFRPIRFTVSVKSGHAISRTDRPVCLATAPDATVGKAMLDGAVTTPPIGRAFTERRYAQQHGAYRGNPDPDLRPRGEGVM